MTALTSEQFAIVVREIETMIADGDAEEATRIFGMFAAGRFNYRPSDFPRPVQDTLAGRQMRRSYPALLADIRRVEGPVFRATGFGRAHGHELVRLDSPPGGLPICLVAGIHGDEADGVLAALELARRFARSRELTASYTLTIFPCINPTGYEQMTRENAAGKDLNREFFRDSREVEVRMMERELKAHSFTGLISGHSDYESFGIYAYATGAVLSERLAKPALVQASSVIPINLEPVIDGHPAQYGIINEKFPGSLGPLTKGESEPFDIVIETPNLFALRKRVEAQAVAFETILHEYRAVAAEAMYL